MNTSIHLVEGFWYRLYWGLVLVFCVAAGVASALAMYLPHAGLTFMEAHKETFALEPPILIISGLTILYCLTFYHFIKKRDQTMATFICLLLFTVLVLAGITLGSGAGTWVYVGGWFVSMFFAGIYGAPMVLSAFLLIAVFVLPETKLQLSDTEAYHWALLGGSTLVGVSSYYFWRNHIPGKSDPINRHLSQLTGMLRTKEEQAITLIQSIADGVIVTNMEGKITLMNSAAANMTGWTVEDAAGISVEQVFKVAKENGEEIPEKEYPFVAVLAHKAFFNQVLQLTSRKGKKQVISLVISPVVTPKGEVFGAVAVLRDISEQRAAEQQRAEFISTASHEMRTPVAAIEGYLALALNDKVSTIDSRARNYLEKAHSSTQHLGKLFQDLLTSARAEDGRLTSHPQVVEMGEFLERLEEDLRFSAQKKNLNTEFVIGSNEAIDATSDKNDMKVVKPLYYVHVDPDRIREVVTNLFDNAVKYTDEGRVTIGLTGNHEVVQIYIRDTGPGIPAEDLPHLFQKFYRVDNSATRTVGGTGLGLFIARKIIELYHGRIWAESQLGKGSTFYINLPRINNQKAQELLNASAQQNPTQP